MKEKVQRIDTLVRLSVILAMIALLCMFFFLASGFTATSVGIGVFLGFTLMLVAIIIYIIAVVRDLRRRGAL